jgi:hypothetical protein
VLCRNGRSVSQLEVSGDLQEFHCGMVHVLFVAVVKAHDQTAELGISHSEGGRPSLAGVKMHDRSGYHRLAWD